MPFSISGLMVNNPRPTEHHRVNNKLREGLLTSLRLDLDKKITEPSSPNISRQQDSIEISDAAQKWSGNSLRLGLNKKITESSSPNISRQQDSIEISAAAQKWSDNESLPPAKPVTISPLSYQTYLDACDDIQQSIAAILEKNGIQVDDKEYMHLTVDDTNKIMISDKGGLVEVSAKKQFLIETALNAESWLGEKINSYKEICNKIPMPYRDPEFNIFKTRSVSINDIDQRPESVKQRQNSFHEFVKKHYENTKSVVN